MVSTEIIKKWGGGQNGGAENNFGGAFAPPGAATVYNDVGGNVCMVLNVGSRG